MDLKLKKKFLSLSKIFVKTKKMEKNNKFSYKFYRKKISITGKKFDARNLPKILSEKSRVIIIFQKLVKKLK